MLKELLKNWLKQRFSNLPDILLSAFLGSILTTGVVSVFYEKLWVYLKNILLSPTPLWVYIVSILALYIYVHTRINNIHSSKKPTLNISVFNNLSIDEKKYLKPYVKVNTKTQYFRPNGIVASLLVSNIIYLASESCELDDEMQATYAYNIEDWALSCLKKYPELLK